MDVKNPQAFDVYNQQVTGGVSMTLTAKRSDTHHIPVVFYDAYQHYGYKESSTAGTLTTGTGMIRGDTPLAVVAVCGFSDYKEAKISSTLRAEKGADLGGGSESLVISSKKEKKTIRKLTPTECARLQGFPDWWVDGAEGSDSAIYKMWGNGIALPCAADVIGRLAKELEKGG